MAAGQALHVFVCWDKASLFINWGPITTVSACNSASGTLTNVLPHWSTQYTRHGADLSLCYPLMCVVITTFSFMKVLHNAGSVAVWSCIIILENETWCWLVVFYVPSTARSFRDGTPIYCLLRRTWSSVFTPFPPRIEPRAVASQSITQPLRHASSCSLVTK